MLAYVYGVVPLSLCRNGACGGTSTSDDANGDEEVAYGEEVLVTSFHKTRIFFLLYILLELMFSKEFISKRRRNPFINDVKALRQLVI